MKGFTLMISGDPAGHLLYAFPDLVSGQQNSGLFRLNAGHSPASVFMVISSIKTASPELQAKSLEAGKDRIQTIFPALSITGQALRWSGEISCPNRADCNNSFTFLGDWVWTGKNLSPARQFLTFSSGPSRLASKSVAPL